MRRLFLARLVLLFRIALGCFGLWVLSIGARGLLAGHPFAANQPVGKWLLNGVIVHDALLAPAVFVLCAVAYRLTSVRVRQGLGAILLIGGSAFIVGLPALLRKGRNSNPTVTPLDYHGDLIIVLLAVAGGVTLVMVTDARRAARRARRESEPEPELELVPTSALELASGPVPAAVLELEPEPEPDPELEAGAEKLDNPVAIHPMSGIELFDHDEVRHSTGES